MVHNAQYAPLPTAAERPPNEGHGQLSTPHANSIVNGTSPRNSGPDDRVTGFMVERNGHRHVELLGIWVNDGSRSVRSRVSRRRWIGIKTVYRLIGGHGSWCFGKRCWNRNGWRRTRSPRSWSPKLFDQQMKNARRWPDQTELKRLRRGRQRVPVWKYRFRRRRRRRDMTVFVVSYAVVTLLFFRFCFPSFRVRPFPHLSAYNNYSTCHVLCMHYVGDARAWPRALWLRPQSYSEIRRRPERFRIVHETRAHSFVQYYLHVCCSLFRPRNFYRTQRAFGCPTESRVREVRSRKRFRTKNKHYHAHVAFTRSILTVQSPPPPRQLRKTIKHVITERQIRTRILYKYKNVRTEPPAPRIICCARALYLSNKNSRPRSIKKYPRAYIRFTTSPENTTISLYAVQYR